MRSKIAALAVLLFAALPLHAQAPPVLMISIDGMKPEYVTHADEHGLKLPALRALMNQGAYAEGVTGVFPTVTYPSHTTLITGVWPAQHGIENNLRFDPEHQLDSAWYWYADQIKAPTLWSVAHAAGLRTASVGWPATADSSDIDFLIPEYWRVNVADPFNPDDRFLMNALSRPVNEIDRIAARTKTPYIAGNDTSPEGDRIKTVYSLDILKQEKPRFMTVHLSSLDEQEHLHGPFSSEANADLEQIDRMVAQLVEQARANDPKAVIVVVSDHGFADINTYVNFGAAFVDAGLIVPAVPATGAAPAAAATWQAQPWALGGMFAIMLHDPADAAVKQKVRALLDRLASDPQNGIEDILDQARIAQVGGPPEAAYLVTLRKGFVPGSNVTGPLITPIPGHRGTHGYNPLTTPEMRSSLFIAGSGIARGKDLGVVDMRSIAPTVANLLGVSIPAAQPALAVR